MKHILISLMLFFSLVSVCGKTEVSYSNRIQVAGFADALDELKTTIERTEQLISRIAGTIETITSLAGLKTIIFLALVLALSSGIGNTGLVKGKNIFFLSTALLDLLWFFWLGIYYESRSNLFQEMLKTNIIILSPFIILLCIKYISPWAIRLARSFNRKNRHTKKFCMKSWNEFNHEAADFTSYFNSDIHEGTEHVVLSAETVKSAKKLTILLKELSSRESKV